MKYYLAADGGGTKLNLILYDQNLKIINAVKGSGINETRKDKDLILKECTELVNELLLNVKVKEIEEFTYSLASSVTILQDVVADRVSVKRMVSYSEGQTVIASAGLSYGVVAQAGTGSDVFVYQPNLTKIIGGLGSVLGDDGGGFDIGLKSIKSAIKSYENRGEKTLLEQAVFEKFGVNDSRELIALVREKNFNEQISSVTYITSKLARQGDKVAVEIYKNAGKDMAGQVNFALKVIGENNLVGKVIVSGGAWKGFNKMYKTFYKTVKKSYPNVQICFPYFEPIVGCVIARLASSGVPFDKVKGKLKRNFANYLFDKGDIR